MITFTDPRLYVQGIGAAIMTDAKGNIKFFSDKFQEANVTVSNDEGIVNAGLGNAPVVIIPSNPNVAVSATTADYSEYAKAAAVGGKLSYGAPVMTCQTVTASGAALSIDVSGGAPVAAPGLTDVICYVQEVGAASSVSTDNIAYALDASSGAITGFTATSGKTYLVSYYVSQANASMTTITTNTKGEVVRFVFQRPIYTNVDEATNAGDLWGWLYEIVPRLQLMPDGAANNGNQSSPTTTAISGRAISFDADTISANCSECEANGAPLMYRIIVPCDKTTGIDGIVGVLGGEVILDGTTPSFQLRPAIIVNNALSYGIASSEFTYEVTSGGTYFSVSEFGLVTSTGTTGDGEILVSYTVGTKDYTDYINVSYSGD